MIIHHLLLKESDMIQFPTTKDQLLPVRITGDFSPVCDTRQMSSSAMLGTTSMQMQAPYMLPQQPKGSWVHSHAQVYYPQTWTRRTQGYLSHSATQTQRVSAQYMQSALLWLPQHQLHQDQRVTQWRPESSRMAYQARVPWSYRQHLTGGPMDARMYPIFSTEPQQAPTGLLPQAGDSSTHLAPHHQLGGPFQAGSNHPLFEFQSYSLRTARVSQASRTQVTCPSLSLQGLGDSSLPAVTSLEEAMKIFHCESEDEPRQQAEAGLSVLVPQGVLSSPTQEGSGRGKCPSTLDHSLDQEDLEACMERLLESQGSEGSVCIAAAGESGMEFFYEVDSLGSLCDLQLFGQYVSSSNTEEGSANNNMDN
ncbi:uncharacterized protein [Salmo salar]|uniref:Uncharacterized protein n=1 Tax=Salmo salar TaxID=8030 RepID=A0A1S3LRD8_SALSA|nr:uncharacterized protein LOC106568064 [Salmo salar]